MAAWPRAKQGFEDPKHLGCSDPKRPGCSDPKRPGCSDPKRPGCGDPKRPGCSDPKRPGCGDPKRRDASSAHNDFHTSSVAHLQRFARPSLCLWCRRCCYAKAATGKGNPKVLTRYQEWCLPLLPASQGTNMYVCQVFDIVRLAGFRLQHTHTFCRPLSLQAQALQGTRSCTCATSACTNHPERASFHRRTRFNSDRHHKPEYGKDVKQGKARGVRQCRWVGRRRVKAIQNRAHRARQFRRQPCRMDPMTQETNARAEGDRTRLWPASVYAGKQRWTGGGKRKHPASDARKCFFCCQVGPDYHPFSLDDVYVATCALCQRLACCKCGSWELRQFYCPWCGDNRGISEEACQTISAMKMCAKAYQEIQETVDWSDHIVFVQTLKQLCPHPCSSAMYTHVAMKAGSATVPEDVSHLLEALLLSYLGSVDHVQKLWAGLESEWEQNLLQHATSSSTENELETIAQILVEGFQEKSLSMFPDDRQRLRVLAAEGWDVLPASSHAANNCLLDSLLLSMLGSDAAPTAAELSKTTRANLCRAARQHLRALVDPGVVSPNGLCTFLDAHTHGPAAVRFLYGKLRALAPLPRLRPNFEIRVYSRFDSVDVNPEELGILIPGEGASEAPFQILPLYPKSLFLVNLLNQQIY